MRILAIATALLAALLTGASVAAAADVGANDDSAKFQHDGGAAMYAEMAGLGMKQSVIGVRFIPSEAMVIQDKPQLDRAIAAAHGAGLRVVLAVYPYPPREIEAGMSSPALFASYVGVLASIYPEVKHFVIGNEPNQPAFWRPQFDASGQNASAPAFGPYLAAAYDTLKGVDPAITVVEWGSLLAATTAPTPGTTSRRLRCASCARSERRYRKSGRTRPLMDGFSFHPYPNEATDPLERGYAWPNAGFVNLDRMKQALWDGFNGTPQPTTVDGLKVHLDEVGWQVDTSGHAGYRGSENVPVTDEVTQAAIYGQLVREAACDPDVASLSFFGYRDDGLRSGFQAGLARADGTVRPSAASVQAAITSAPCEGVPRVWAPGIDVLGTKVSVGGQSAAVRTRLAAGEDARAKVCLRSLDIWWTYTPSRCTTVSVQGLRTLNVALKSPVPASRKLEVLVEFAAEANRKRRTVVVQQALLRR